MASAMRRALRSTTSTSMTRRGVSRSEGSSGAMGHGSVIAPTLSPRFHGQILLRKSRRLYGAEPLDRAAVWVRGVARGHPKRESLRRRPIAPALLGAVLDTNAPRIRAGRR